MNLMHACTIMLFMTFADINECATYNGACDHFCTNTDGSYTCSCSSGYQLESDGHNCTGTANS